MKLCTFPEHQVSVIITTTNVLLCSVAAGRGAKGGMPPGRHCVGAAFGEEFGNSASGKLAFAL